MESKAKLGQRSGFLRTPRKRQWPPSTQCPTAIHPTNSFSSEQLVLGAERFLESVRDLVYTWKDRMHQNGMIRPRDVVDRETLDWSVEMPERLPRDRRRNLRPETCREIVLMNDQHVARLYDRRQDRRAIPRSDRPEIDYFDLP